ncbi:acyltransferase family protein [Spirosoma harenae]
MFTEIFGPLSIYPGICIVAIAFLTMHLLGRIEKFKPSDTQYKAIDSLKFFLALIVFISHSSTWYYYLRTGRWTVPPTNLYAQVVHTSIELFFMITAFLLCNKITERKIDWLKLYVGRIVRLFPIYIIAVSVLFFIIGCLSKFRLNEGQSWMSLASQLKKWTMFTIKNDPDINGIENTWIIVCKVMWTLRYEWVFYLSLPIIALLFFKKRPKYILLLISVSLITYMLLYWEFALILYTPFLGGILASLLINTKIITRLSTHWMGSILVLLLLGILVILYQRFNASSYDVIPLMIITSIFVLITHGNTIFGFLSLQLTRKLGQLSYGIYLFHGLLLYTLFKFIVGFDKSASLSNTQHWIYLFLLTPVLISISFFLHIYIEAPALKYTAPITDKLRSVIRLFKHQIIIRWAEMLNVRSRVS